MSVRVVGSTLVSDQTEHQAKSVGLGGWVVSFLPGRTITKGQASAAMEVADAVAKINEFADSVGLTTLETVWFALQDSSWTELARGRRCPLWPLRRR